MTKTKSQDIRLYGSIPHFPGVLKVILVKYSKDIFLKQINYIKPLTKVSLKWVIVLWVICHLYPLHITWM